MVKIKNVTTFQATNSEDEHSSSSISDTVIFEQNFAKQCVISHENIFNCFDDTSAIKCTIANYDPDDTLTHRTDRNPSSSSTALYNSGYITDWTQPLFDDVRFSAHDASEELVHGDSENKPLQLLLQQRSSGRNRYRSWWQRRTPDDKYWRMRITVGVMGLVLITASITIVIVMLLASSNIRGTGLLLSKNQQQAKLLSGKW